MSRCFYISVQYDDKECYLVNFGSSHSSGRPEFTGIKHLGIKTYVRKHAAENMKNLVVKDLGREIFHWNITSGPTTTMIRKQLGCHICVRLQDETLLTIINISNISITVKEIEREDLLFYIDKDRINECLYIDWKTMKHSKSYCSLCGINFSGVPMVHISFYYQFCFFCFQEIMKEANNVISKVPMKRIQDMKTQRLLSKLEN